MARAPLVLVAAALAGITTLAAELLWMRGLGRGVGMTPEALAVVAGLVLAGLGLGAAFGARTAPDSERPARAAGLCLLGAGTLVALSPTYLELVPGLHVGLLDVLGLDGSGGPVPVLVLAAPLTLPAAWLLGTAFPYLVRTRVMDMRYAATRTGWIYGLNTVGALVGVIGALTLLPTVGEAMALRIAGGCALLGALLLLLHDRPLPHGAGPPEGGEPGRSLGAGPVGPVLFASGAAALVAQLAWVRLLEPLVGPQLWGMGLLLGPVLLGVALGAVVAGRVADRVRRAGLLLAGVLVLAGALTILSLWTSGSLPQRLVGAAAGGPWARALSLMWGIFLVSGPPMLAFGAALPLAVRVHADLSGSSSAAAGRMYAWNTLGALCGGVVAGFLLLPLLGAERTLVIAGTLAIVAAAALRLRTGGSARVVPAALHVAPLAALLLPGLLGNLLRSGPDLTEVIAASKPLPPGIVLEDRADLRLYASWFAGQRAARPHDATGTPLPPFEGRAGRVELIEEPDGTVGLRHGALREAAFDPDRPDRPGRTETALALLPGLLRPAGERVLVVGHGAGWTAEAALALGVEHLVVAELDAAVLSAARAYRGLERLPVEADPRARIVESDGLQLLRRAAAGAPEARYDWIASQPSHPWSATAAHLFTQEAYASARAALREDGVMAQWLNLFDLSPRLLRSALGAFRAVFDEVWVFRFPGDLILVGCRSPLRVDTERWESLLMGDGACARYAAAAGLRHPGELWKHFALDTEGLDRVLGTDPGSLRDDRPRLEFEVAWRRMAGTATWDGERILFEGFPPDMAAALPRAPLRERWLTQAVLGWLRDGYGEEARQWSSRIRWGASADAKAAQGLAALEGDQVDRAEDLLSRASSQAPERGDLAAHRVNALAARALKQGDPTRTLEQVDQVATRFPQDGRVLAAAARAHRGVGRTERALVLFEQAVAAAEPEAPPGTGIQFARLLLSVRFRPEDERRAAALLAKDPATYERVDALDMYLRLRSQAGDEEGAATIEAALRTLEAAQGLARFRAAAGHLARHEFEDAVREARECRTIWASQPTAWELEGLVLLAADGARRSADAERPPDVAEAVEAFVEAVARSEEPDAARARAVRMLRWYGHDPDAFEAAVALRMP